MKDKGEERLIISKNVANTFLVQNLRIFFGEKDVPKSLNTKKNKRVCRNPFAIIITHDKKIYFDNQIVTFFLMM